jgi:putative transposase
MPRRPRLATGGLAYHVLNRRVGRLPLFEKSGDYAAFEQILQQVYDRARIRVVAYCLMPNHWHLLLWPRRDGELSEVVRWLTMTPTQRWHAHHKTSGTGPVYQGRFKSFPVQTDEHFLAVARYVERNAVRAKLVERAEDWPWCSLWRRSQADPKVRTSLSEWPMEPPRRWVTLVNGPEMKADLEALLRSVNRGRPFGAEAWVARIAKRLSLESTLRPRGRPKCVS